MKLTAILGAGLLAFSGTLALSTNLFATTADETSVVASAKPSQAELRSAISRVENIENYHAYSLLPVNDLAAKTSFYREYTYLFELVASAKDLDENYDTSSAKDISEIIAAAKDAEIACGYLFGTIARQNSASNTSSSSHPQESSTPSVPLTPSPNQPQASSTLHTVVAIAPPSTTNSNSDTPKTTPAPQTPEVANHDSAAESNGSTEPVSVPATGEVEAKKDNKPFFVTLSAVVLACLLIGAMIILNRKKSYHPGRKF